MRSWNLNIKSTVGWVVLGSLGILLALMVVSPVTDTEQPATTPFSSPLGWNDREACSETTGEGKCRCAKVAAWASSADCSAPEEDSSSALAGETRSEGKGKAGQSRQVAASTLVEKALQDQRAMLAIKVEELNRWDSNDQRKFARWFGTASEDARSLIRLRVLRVIELNKNYTVQNFRRGKHREGVYAYVYPNQPSKVYLDDQFLRQKAVGLDSRPGTITHEMSHFSIIGGTKDHAYGPAKCRELASRDSQLALTNADNFEFWAEESR